MPPRRARIQRVEFPVYNPIESHRASASTDHGRENKSKRSPTWPAPIRSRRYRHGGQCEWQCEDSVRKPDELSPFAHHRKKIKSHSLSSPHLLTRECATPK